MNRYSRAVESACQDPREMSYETIVVELRCRHWGIVCNAQVLDGEKFNHESRMDHPIYINKLHPSSEGEQQDVRVGDQVVAWKEGSALKVSMWNVIEQETVSYDVKHKMSTTSISHAANIRLSQGGHIFLKLLRWSPTMKCSDCKDVTDLSECTSNGCITCCKCGLVLVKERSSVQDTSSRIDDDGMVYIGRPMSTMYDDTTVTQVAGDALSKRRKLNSVSNLSYLNHKMNEQVAMDCKGQLNDAMEVITHLCLSHPRGIHSGAKKHAMECLRTIFATETIPPKSVRVTAQVALWKAMDIYNKKITEFKDIKHAWSIASSVKEEAINSTSVRKNIERIVHHSNSRRVPMVRTV
jgi:hypothetical protein